jgi:hypothetical protein
MSIRNEMSPLHAQLRQASHLKNFIPPSKVAQRDTEMRSPSWCVPIAWLLVARSEAAIELITRASLHS